MDVRVPLRVQVQRRPPAADASASRRRSVPPVLPPPAVSLQQYPNPKLHVWGMSARPSAPRWSVHSHDLHPAAERAHAVALMRLGYLLAPRFRQQAGALVDVWRHHVLPLALAGGAPAPARAPLRRLLDVMLRWALRPR